MRLKLYGYQEIDQELDEDKDLSISFLLTRIKKVEKNKSDDQITYKIENIGEVVIVQEDKVI